jgi:hypothetical protein
MGKFIKIIFPFSHYTWWYTAWQERALLGIHASIANHSENATLLRVEPERNSTPRQVGVCLTFSRARHGMWVATDKYYENNNPTEQNETAVMSSVLGHEGTFDNHRMDQASTSFLSTNRIISVWECWIGRAVQSNICNGFFVKDISETSIKPSPQRANYTLIGQCLCWDWSVYERKRD